MNIKHTLTEEEIISLGLKSGIEIHQQIEGRKLFSRTPTMIRDDKADFVVKRFIRASAGESGKVDVAAAAEVKKKKYYLYEGYHDTTGLVELDEEPPAPVSKAALDSALQVAKIFNMQVVDQLRFMRKTVVNGSNTSGFQRTGLVGVNGTFETENCSVSVLSLLLEEDSCKEVESTAEYTTYNLSRLGIPLFEIATGPDMKTPEQVKEVAEYIGMVLRSISNVKRGLGTIRQDVNISIANGERVEIKGAQDLKMIPTLVTYEALRQHNMLEIFEELRKRRASVEDDIVDLTSVFSNTQSKIIRGSLDKGGVVLGVKLNKFVGLTGIEVQPGRRFGSELSDYAKVMGVKGLIHGDEDLSKKYSFSEEEIEAVKSQLQLGSEDGFLLIADTQEVAHRALVAAIDRARDFGLRKEVRVARPDGTTSYMRPMPGAARMYPETDVMPVTIDMSTVAVPKLLDEQISDMSKEFSVAEDIAKKIIRDGIDFANLCRTYSHVKPSFIVDLFYSLPGVVKKQKGLDVDMKFYADELLEKLNSNAITKDSLVDIVVQLAQGKPVDYSQYKPLSIDDIKDDVTSLVSSMKDKPRGAIMGQVMAKYKGKVDGKELSSFVATLL